MRKTFYLAITLLILACGAEQASNHDNTNKAKQIFDICQFPEKWITLKQQDTLYFVHKPCDSGLSGIEIDSKLMTLEENNGHRLNRFKIKSYYKTGNQCYNFECIKNEKDSVTQLFSFENKEAFTFNTGKWTISYSDSTTKWFFATIKRKFTDFIIVYEPCTRCHDDCFDIFPSDWIDNQSIQHYLNNKSISDVAKKYFLRHHSLNVDYQTLSMLDSLFCYNKSNRAFYFVVFNMIINEQNILIKEYTSKKAREFVERMPEIFFSYVSEHQLPENGLLLWTKEIAWNLTYNFKDRAKKIQEINLWLAQFSKIQKQMSQLQSNYFNEFEIMLKDNIPNQ